MQGKTLALCLCDAAPRYHAVPMAHTQPMEVLFTADQIQRRVIALAGDIRRDHPDGLHLLAVLKGAFIFLADLVRQLDGPVSLDFVALSSYKDGTVSSGAVNVLKDAARPITGAAVVIIEDIVDSGLTLATLQQQLAGHRPRSLRTACLLDKPSRRKARVQLDYVGFTVEDRFVVGYGLDHADRYRNLPYIAALD